MRRTIKERVAKGAALLDKHEPHWVEMIDRAKLDLSECRRCIAGQVMLASVGSIYADYKLASVSHLDATYGFDLTDREYRSQTPDRVLWMALEGAWLHEIEQRIQNMDIGKEERTIRVDPVKNPIPQKVPERKPQTVPRREPATPSRTPAREPVKK